MRYGRSAVLMATLSLAACSGFRDVFTSHAETAARVGSKELKAAFVADIINKVGGPQANPQVAEVVTNIWVDIALFADQVARGNLKIDSAFLDRMLWPQLTGFKSQAFKDTLLARRAVVTEASADSAYNKGELRLFQHILIQPKGASRADSNRAAAEAARIIPQARADFGKTAAQYSVDNQNKSDKGYLPVLPKGAYVPAFDSAAWALAPGQMSGVVPSSFGYHIIRRPPAAEIRPRIIAKLKELQAQQQDSLYYAEMVQQYDVKVRSGAASAMRSALSDPVAARRSGKELVSFKGGSFTVGDFVRWIGALPPQQMSQIRQANDTVLTNFVKNLAQNTIQLQQADSAKVTVDTMVHRTLQEQYRTAVADLRQGLGLDAPELSDSSKLPVAEKVKLAGQKVDEYWDKLTKGEAQFRPVPPTLTAELRTMGDFKVYQAGISRAIELVVAKRRADSAAGTTGPPPAAQPPAVQPAPGGPPEPGKRP